MAYHPFRHLGLKVLAIALACLLWVTVAGQHVVERSVRVPLEFRNPPPELEIVGDPPASVDVRLRGSSALLSRLEPGDVVAVLDLSTARPGARLFHLRPDDVRAPFGIDVAQVVPATVPVELERSGRRTVPVLPNIEGKPAPGFVTGRVTADPPTVEIEGPESRLKALSGATTEVVSIDGRRELLRDQVTVGVSDSAVRLLRPETANVTVEIVPAPVERQLEGVPVRWRNLGSGLRAQVTPTLAHVSVRGRRNALADMRADAVNAFVDLAGLGPGRYNLRVQVEPSEQFGVTGVDPAVVQVTIR